MSLRVLAPLRPRLCSTTTTTTTTRSASPCRLLFPTPISPPTPTTTTIPPSGLSPSPELPSPRSAAPPLSSVPLSIHDPPPLSLQVAILPSFCPGSRFQSLESLALPNRIKFLAGWMVFINLPVSPYPSPCQMRCSVLL